MTRTNDQSLVDRAREWCAVAGLKLGTLSARALGSNMTLLRAAAQQQTLPADKAQQLILFMDANPPETWRARRRRPAA